MPSSLCSARACCTAQDPFKDTHCEQSGLCTYKKHTCWPSCSNSALPTSPGPIRPMARRLDAIILRHMQEGRACPVLHRTGCGKHVNINEGEARTLVNFVSQEKLEVQL